MSRDIRRYAAQTNIRIAVGALALLFSVGLGLIWVVYGAGAALSGLLCLLGTLVPIALIVLVIWGLDWLVKRSNDR